MKIVFKIVFVFFLILILNNQVMAGCEDKPGDGVSYEGCAFADGQDLSGTFIPNSNLNFTSFIKVNFATSIMMNSTLINGTFSEANFFRVNLYESNLEGGNFENANFESANLTKTIFKASSLINVSFKNSNLYSADLTYANISGANFENANLNEVTWIDGTKCAINSIGECKK